MAIIKKTELKNISKQEIENKINELKIELMKERNEKGGKALKIREIRKTLAKLFAIKNKSDKEKREK